MLLPRRHRYGIDTETIAVAIKELDKCLKVTDNSGALSAALSAGAAAGVTVTIPSIPSFLPTSPPTALR